MEEFKDTYKTIAKPVQAAMRERSSKFLSFAYPVENTEQVKEIMDECKKKYYNATHRCYAYRIGPSGEEHRANDDGEPSGTAGKPILGQLLSLDITNCLVVVVRYFGGTKLGVSGLIAAYRESAAEALKEAEIITRTVDALFEVTFPYAALNDIMRITKDMQPVIVRQTFDNICKMELAIRESLAAAFEGRLKETDGVSIERIDNKYGE